MSSPKQSRYFEGVLQLRNPTEEVVGFFKSEMGKRPDVSIAKVERLRKGMDIYVSSKKYLQQVGRRLQEKFGGELKISAEHFSRNRVTSRDVFRVNVLYRYTGIKEGDVINVRGEDIRIIHVGKKLHVMNMATGRKHFLDFDELPKY